MARRKLGIEAPAATALVRATLALGACSSADFARLQPDQGGVKPRTLTDAVSQLASIIRVNLMRSRMIIAAANERRSGAGEWG